MPVATGEQYTLPLFEGRQPHAAKTKLSGTCDTPIRPLRLGDEITVVATATVTKVGHEDKDGVITRVHTLKVDQVYELTGDDAARALEAGQVASLQAGDAQQGQDALFGPAKVTATVLPDGGAQ